MISFIKYFFILFAILIICVVALSIYLVKFQPNQLISQEIRQIIIQSPKIRELVKINQAGDARYEYLNDDNTPITVRVLNFSNSKPDKDLEAWITDMVSITTGKSILVTQEIISDQPLKPQYSDDDLVKLLEQINTTSSDSPYLDIIYLSTYAEVPSHVGLVNHSNTIYMFKDVVRNLTSQPAVQSRIEQSTLMHEWGHLLGLEHVDQEKCVMSGTVEVFEKRKVQNRNIPIEYCTDTLIDIRN